MERAEPLTAATARLTCPVVDEQDKAGLAGTKYRRRGRAARKTWARDGLHQAEFASHGCGHRTGFTLRLRVLRLGLLRGGGGEDETI